MTNLDTSLRPPVQGLATAARNRAMLLHDLRSALNAMMGTASLLERQVAAGSELGIQVARISEAAGSIAELVGELTNTAESVGEVRLSALLRRMERLWSGEAGQHFRIDAEGGLPETIAVDAQPVDRILCNLLCNAFRHSGSAEVTLDVRRTPDGGVILAVLDRGAGLTEMRINALRDGGPTQTRADGHGMGLGIARDLSREIGANFMIANRPGGGLEVGLVIPARFCSLANGRPEPAAPPPAAARAGLSGRRVLLAEDNQTNQIVATQMLRALDAEVTLASDGVEALERFEEEEFDLVVVDIEMPRLSGLDVIRAIRARRDARANAPIVALTAYAMREHRDRISAAGANGLISKPLTSIDALGEALSVHLAPEAEAPRPAPKPATAEEPVADQAVFDSLCRAIGQEMMDELLEKVVADLRQARADLAAALAPLDRKPIRAASHILISVAGAIGAVRLQHCARALNTAAHGEETGGLPDEVLRCMDEIDAAIDFANSRRQAT